MEFKIGYITSGCVSITSPELLGLIKWVTSCKYPKIRYHYIENNIEEFYF